MNTLSTPKLANSRWPANLVSDEFDRMFDRFFTGDQAPREGWLARLDLWEDDNSYYLEFDAPGVKNEDVEITVEKGVLKVSARREHTEEQEGRKYWHRERRYGMAERQISLPDAANEDAIEAQLNAGVLRVTIGKKPEIQPKKITIKSE